MCQLTNPLGRGQQAASVSGQMQCTAPRAVDQQAVPLGSCCQSCSDQDQKAASTEQSIRLIAQQALSVDFQFPFAPPTKQQTKGVKLVSNMEQPFLANQHESHVKKQPECLRLVIRTVHMMCIGSWPAALSCISAHSTGHWMRVLI